VRRRDLRADDAGVSLVEVMVTLAVMGVVMAVATAGILQTYRAVATTEATAGTQSELRRVHQRLDKVIRYASWVSSPGQAGATWYVEFAMIGGTCAQLRFDTGSGVLQMHQWTAGSPPAAGQPGQTLGSQLVLDGTAPPFQRQAAGSMPYASPGPAVDAGASFAPDYYRLRVRLAAQNGRGVSRLDATFSALNTSRDMAGTHPCSEGRP
jgi:prepilin-type N-terminal cleavage/methylation domain-containing protein